MGYFNNNSPGYIISVTTNSMETLSNIATRVVMMVSTGVLNALVVTLILFFFDWRIGLIIAAAGMVLYFLVNSMLQRKSSQMTDAKNRSDSTLVECVLEYIQGIAEVKAYHLTGKLFKKLNSAIDDNVNINTDLEVALVPWMGVQRLICKFIGMAVAPASIAFYFQGSMTLFNCSMMVICSFMLTFALESAGNYSSLVRMMRVSVAKAQEILDLPPIDID